MTQINHFSYAQPLAFMLKELTINKDAKKNQ